MSPTSGCAELDIHGLTTKERKGKGRKGWAPLSVTAYTWVDNVSVVGERVSGHIGNLAVMGCAVCGCC